jgi:MFS family permease
MITSRQVIRTYYSLTALYTLSVSVIWGINTLFLMAAGLDIFQVMLVNAVFKAGMVLFEVPTGVVADTIGRKISFLLCIAVLFVTTLLYVAASYFSWGVWGFVAISVLIGLGFTFFTGAVEAWLVDALVHTGYEGSTEKVFARGQSIFSVAMLLGTVGGGLLGQLHLSIPYLVRAALLFSTFFIVLFLMKDLGFQGRSLSVASFGTEAKKVFLDGMNYGWNNPVLRLCVLVSFVEGLFFIFGWYSWQRYFLDLLTRELVWVAGIVSALMALSMILGNTLVGRMVRDNTNRPAILAINSLVRASAIVAAGVLGAVVPAESRGILLFSVVVMLYLLFGVSFGLSNPIRMAFINRHIPSPQRATVLSVDSLFNEGGGMIGQTGLGYLSKKVSIPVAWMLGGLVLFAGYPLYKRAEKAAGTDDVTTERPFDELPTTLNEL